MAKVGKKLSKEEEKAKLITELLDVRERIIEETSLLGPEHVDERFLGTWSIMDLIAHLAGWDVTNLEAARDILKGNLPGFYAYHDRDWSSYNTKLIATHKCDDFEDMIASMQATHNELIRFLNNIPASEFYEDRGIRSKGYKVILARLLQAEKDDEEEHWGQIRAFVESVRSS